MRFDFPCQEHGRTGCRECRRAEAHERYREKLSTDEQAVFDQPSQVRPRQRAEDVRSAIGVVLAVFVLFGAIALAWQWAG